MAVGPVTLHGMFQRTNDVSTIKQNEDNRPMTEQQVIQGQQVKQEQALAHKVANLKQKENEGYRYDAKEKGNGSYQEQKKKKPGQKESDKKGDKVSIKGQSSHFDIKI